MSSSGGRPGLSKATMAVNITTPDQPLANILQPPPRWFIDFLETHSVTPSDDLCMHYCSRSSFTNIQFQFMAPLFMSNFLFVLINIIGGCGAGGAMLLLLLRSSNSLLWSKDGNIKSVRYERLS